MTFCEISSWNRLFDTIQEATRVLMVKAVEIYTEALSEYI